MTAFRTGQMLKYFYRNGLSDYLMKNPVILILVLPFVTKQTLIGLANYHCGIAVERDYMCVIATKRDVLVSDFKGYPGLIGDWVANDRV